VQRTISKSSHVYKNRSWDLVDASEDDDRAIEEAEDKYLPKEMKGKTLQEKKYYVSKQRKKRATLQKEIKELAIKRKQYIAENQPESNNDNMLDKVMVNSIKEAAKTKQLIFE